MGIVCKITGHKWNKLPDGSDGCKCTRCGRVRDEGHDWQKATANFGAKEHRRQCRICGRYETERHSFKLLPNCQSISLSYINSTLHNPSSFYTSDKLPYFCRVLCLADVLNIVQLSNLIL